MKLSTINKYKKILNDAKNSGKSLNAFCVEQGLNYKSIVSLFSGLHKEQSEETKELINLYDQVVQFKNAEDISKASVEYERDEEGHIQYYNVVAYIKDKAPFKCKLNREETETIFGLYTYYGGNITARNVANEFPKFTLPEIKRIFRAFNLTKDSIWVPQHLIEELSVEDLNSYRFNLKERAAFKYADARQERDYKNLVNKMASRINELEGTLNRFNNIKVTLLNTPSYKVKNQVIESNKDLILHLSDMHIGAKVESGCIYPNNWNENELVRRLSEILNRINSLGHLNTLVINLLGDNLDGMDNQTARRDHFMPQNMDNMEQVNVFINTITWFITSIKENNLCNKIKIYAVKCGNHDGDFGYAASVAALSCISKLFPDVETTQFTEFFGYYEFNNHKFLISHGKDSKFMKRGMPLNLDDKNKMKLYEYLDSKGITGTGIHIIKGDLHTENINSCLKLDYRNVLSLFGASDYSALNFGRNQYGASYELFIGDNLIRGTFENI